MKGIAVDTSVLLSIFKGEPSGKLWLECLQTAAKRTSLIVSSIVLAEVRSFFHTEEACRRAIQNLELKHSPLSEDSALLAGKILHACRAEGGPRSTILPDFLIAAHAVCQADSLATEDRGYLRRYFPSIRLMKA